MPDENKRYPINLIYSVIGGSLQIDEITEAGRNPLSSFVPGQRVTGIRNPADPTILFTIPSPANPQEGRL